MIRCEARAAVGLASGYVSCSLRDMQGRAVKSAALLGLLSCWVSLKLIQFID
jgi:hypothetical protein